MKRFLGLPKPTAFLCGLGLLAFPNASIARADGWCCFNKTQAPAYPVGPPVPVSSGAPAGTTLNSYYGNYGATPPSPGPVFAAGLPQTSAALLPTAAYDTRWVQTPVTYYRPVTQFDPRYGTTVTSLQPCTSYQYQAARVPLVAPAGTGPSSYGPDRWPAINAPGYFPTALAPTTTAYPTLQQLPNTGTQISANMVPYANQGSSSGPASTLPLATMSSPTNAMVAPANYWNATTPGMMAPTNGVVSATASMPAAAPYTSVPITSAVPGTGTPVYTMPAAVPATAMANCPNGVCNVAPSGMTTAASMIPLGPPTIMPATTMPATASGTTTMPLPSTNPSVGAAPSTFGLQNPVPFTGANPTPATGYSTNGTITPILPGNSNPNPVFPPGNGAADPEATRQPTLGNGTGTSAGVFPPSSESSVATFPLKRVPVSELKPNNTNATLPLSNPFVDTAKTSTAAKMVAPPVLPPSNVQPLQAPSDFDAKPRWNPKLLPPTSDPKGETVASTDSIPSSTV